MGKVKRYNASVTLNAYRKPRTAAPEITSLSSENHAANVMALAGCMTEERWLTLLGQEWLGFERTEDLYDDLYDTAAFRRGRRIDQMMTKQELAALEALPDSVTIHRGYDSDRFLAPEGVNWTLDENQAHWFGKKNANYNYSGVVYSETIDKEAILALKIDKYGQKNVIMCAYWEVALPVPVDDAKWKAHLLARDEAEKDAKRADRSYTISRELERASKPKPIEK